MPLSNAETHYFDAMLEADIHLYLDRANEAQAAADRADVHGSPYHLGRLQEAVYNRGVAQGLKLAAQNLEKAQS